MGIPVFANSGVGDIDRIYKTNYPELLIEELSENEYRKKLAAYFKEKGSDKSFLRKTGVDQFSLEKGIRSYQHIYETI